MKKQLTITLLALTFFTLMGWLIAADGDAPDVQSEVENPDAKEIDSLAIQDPSTENVEEVEEMEILLDLETLAQKSVHLRTARQLYQFLQSNHYWRGGFTMNDELGGELFDRYLEFIDPRRIFFLQSDIDEFEAYRDDFDDTLRTNKLDTCFAIFNRIQERQFDRFNWVIDRLGQGLDSFDITTDDILKVRTEDDIEWLANEAEADQLWEKLLTDDIIRYKLRDEEDIIESLTKRYKRNRLRETQTNSDDAFSAYMNSFTTWFDPHTEYLQPKSSETFDIQMSLSLQGIGARLTLDEAEDDYVVIDSTIKGCPADADELGIVEGDRIIAVGQGGPDAPMIDIRSMRLDDVVLLIRGPKGTTVSLEIMKPDEMGAQKRIVSIVRDECKLEDSAAQKEIVTLEGAGADGEDRLIGVIELPSMYVDFAAQRAGKKDYRSATRDVSQLLTELKEQNVEGIVIDLRGNGGGSLEEARTLVGLFIDTGPTVVVQDASGRETVLEDTKLGVEWDGPLAVLIDRRSASASEIFAGAIKDYGRGIVIGNRTFGKGTVQQLLRLGYGELKITQSMFFRVSGESTQHKGVFPDIKYPSLIDTDQIGESSYDQALPYQLIDAREYRVDNRFEKLIPKLKERHEKRVEVNPDFVYYNSLADRLAEDRKRTEYSLNEEKRRMERDEYNTWRINVHNTRFAAKDMEQVETLDELEEVLEALEEEQEDEPDPYLIEAANITSDIVDLDTTYTYIGEGTTLVD